MSKMEILRKITQRPADWGRIVRIAIRDSDPAEIKRIARAKIINKTDAGELGYKAAEILVSRTSTIDRYLKAQDQFVDNDPICQLLLQRIGWFGILASSADDLKNEIQALEQEGSLPEGFEGFEAWLEKVPGLFY